MDVLQTEACWQSSSSSSSSSPLQGNTEQRDKVEALTKGHRQPVCEAAAPRTFDKGRGAGAQNTPEVGKDEICSSGQSGAENTGFPHI